MDENNIRRQYITDEEWNRTSASWKQLKPLKNFNQISEGDETKEQYSLRLQQVGFQIPFQVLDQWIYPLFYNQQTVNNYGWIDYRRVDFDKVVLSVEQLKSLYVIREFRDYVDRRSQSKPFDDFTCIEEDQIHWETYCTWRIPPIVLDISTLSEIPPHSELGDNLQLIEGHTRLGYLYAMENANMLRVREHEVFLLRSM